MHTSQLAANMYSQCYCKSVHPNTTECMQVEKVDVLLSQWKGRIAVVLNADWAPDAVDDEYKKFAASFESVYSFLPVQVQVTTVCHSACLLAQNGQGLLGSLHQSFELAKAA